MVGAIGLGAMQLDDPAANMERAEATMRAALDAGVTLIDTAIAYGPADRGADIMGSNEQLVAALLDRLGVRDEVLVATKGGHTRDTDGGWGLDSSAAGLRRAVDASLKNLGVDQIDLYQHHRPDPKVDYAEAMGTLKEIHDAGKARMLGLSNADPDQIRLARSILGDALVSVQNEFSPRFRSSEPELRLCDELGLAFLPWSPLGGARQAGGLGGRHTAFEEVAAEVGVSPQRVCLAWMLAKSPVVIPIPGASRPESIIDSAAAVELRLSAEQLARLDVS
ncbi:aldo/keto reductase [Nonomuraea sp. NPDC050663]|uniref:aldo/keto reductase n=1 Tax=Nonomuraea sp. NPDC050663 TaxID=3364370 RepID=UPI0037B7B15D